MQGWDGTGWGGERTVENLGEAGPEEVCEYAPEADEDESVCLCLRVCE